MAGDDDTIPFHLMPVAAVVGSIALFGTIRILYLIYASLIKKDSTVTSRNLITWIVSVVLSMLCYAKIVAQVDYAMAQSEYAHFDPFDILGLDVGAGLDEIKTAYRTLSKEQHPDKKGGSAQLFQRLHTAYRALTTDKDNYDQHGHPDGALTNQALSFALPAWLLNPQGTVAIVLVVLYLGMFVAIIYGVIQMTKAPKAKSASDAADNTSVAGADTKYLMATLGPESTHMDILLAIATTPENINLSQQMIDKIDEMRAELIAKRSGKNKKKAPDAFSLDDDGWAADDDDDDATKAAKAEEEVKEAAKKQLAEATGTVDVPMEGLDEGVLGQNWVEQTLAAKGAWPPKDMRFLVTKKFMYKGKLVSAMDHPAVRRNLCFTMGRLNSMVLNTHTELLEASSKKLIDPTYFKASMEYRQRAGLLLEASLRIACTMNSYRLAKTIIEAVSQFKIGVQDPLAKNTLDWFNTVMTKQYSEAGLPRLAISDLNVETPDEKEIATGDLSAITLNMERVHAEAFTKVKVAQCQQQGIPPQIALQSYREGWWVLVRLKKIDGGETPKSEVNPKSMLNDLLSDAEKAKFEDEKDENRLLVAWPMIVQNMAQKSGKVKVQFKAPSVPGKYKIYLAVKSQEFLGTDQEFELPVTVVDVEKVKRIAKEEVKVDEEIKKEN